MTVELDSMCGWAWPAAPKCAEVGIFVTDMSTLQVRKDLGNVSIFFIA